VADNSFALNAHRDITPSDFVELVLLDSAGRHVRTSRWGDVCRSLPSAWIDNEHYRYPSVFVLGAAKSSTTSLHVCLDQHPNVFMSRPKEPLFFEAEYVRGAEFYFNKYFRGWRGEAVVGESRHRNLYLPYVAARIARYNPGAKLIVLLRNPAERAVSHWWHWRSRNLELLPAQAAFEADLERIQTGDTLMLPHEIAT